MNVETYEVPELTSSGEVESDAEAVALIEKLGLEGQKQAINPDRPTERMPYRRMTEEERFVYEQLCPEQTSVERYSAGPIPLRVLQVIAHAREGAYFNQLEVWCPRTAALDDPVLVGVQKDGQFGGRALFLLARWGAVLKPLEELRVIAGREWRIAMLNKARQVLREVEAEVRAMEAMSDEDAALCKKNPYNFNSGPTYSGALG